MNEMVLQTTSQHGSHGVCRVKFHEHRQARMDGLLFVQQHDEIASETHPNSFCVYLQRFQHSHLVLAIAHLLAHVWLATALCTST